MKKLIVILFAVLLLSVPAIADDPYEIERQNLTRRLIENNQPSHEEIGEEEEESRKHRGAVIQGEWDTHGRHYTPAGSGNKVRQDGTFMQKAAGGYIDTKTGKFVPSTD
ncbi:MAG: hypothetical protein PHD57_09165 [Desulfobacterales bacterium]|nr:hypothetical protein [Desulfobacterales bacterium]MDD3081312.1 hypothetical protein [Desulfobacterales bacterium]MDD3950695.1 hypothetical protein [Desulfobacterales bacterium]MDD4464890.1 hypothetical protein [Desulfobacterales bacterium]